MPTPTSGRRARHEILRGHLGCQHRKAQSLLAINGVAEAIPVIVGMSAWILPDGTMTAVIIIGTDASAGGLPPWNIVEERSRA